MPRKLNRRKELQLARRLQEKADDKRGNKKWPGIRRTGDGYGVMPITLALMQAGMLSLMKRRAD